MPRVKKVTLRLNELLETVRTSNDQYPGAENRLKVIDTSNNRAKSVSPRKTPPPEVIALGLVTNLRCRSQMLGSNSDISKLQATNFQPMMRHSETQLLKREDVETTAVANKRLFISYAWGYRANDVRQTAAYFTEHGFGSTYWLDVNKLYGHIPEQLAQAIDESDLVIAFLSLPYQNSVNCKGEAAYIMAAKRPVIAIMLDQTFIKQSWFDKFVNYAAAKMTFPSNADVNVFRSHLLGTITQVLSGTLTSKEIQLPVGMQISGLPIYPASRYYKRKAGTDELIFKALLQQCRRPEQGTLLITGDGGVGKTVLIAQILKTQRNQQTLLESRIDAIIWINCYDWSELAASNYSLQEAENSFTAKIISAVRLLDPTQNFASLYDVVHHFFVRQKRRILFVLDDVFDARLLKFFFATFQSAVPKQSQPPCCVITRDPLTVQLSETRLAPFKQHKIQPLDEGETNILLGTTYGLNDIIQPSDKVRKLASDQICCGLPLIASLIVGQFRISKNVVATYDEIVSSIDEIGKQDAGDKNRRSLNTVYLLMSFNFSQLTDLELRRFYSLVFFDPGALISPVDIAILWGLEADDMDVVVDELDKFEQRSLLRFYVDNEFDTPDENFQVTVHQMLHQSTFRHASETYCLPKEGISLLRGKILVGGLAFKQRNSGEMPLFEAVHNFRRTLLQQTIAKLDAEDLRQICLKRSLRHRVDDDVRLGQTFADFLYKFKKWPASSGNISYPRGHSSERFGCNISYRLLAKILLKIKTQFGSSGLAEIALAKTEFKGDDEPVDEMEESFLDVVHRDFHDANDSIDRTSIILAMVSWHWLFKNRADRREMLANEQLPRLIRLVLIKRTEDAIQDAFEALEARRKLLTDQSEIDKIIRKAADAAALMNDFNTTWLLCDRALDCVLQPHENGVTPLLTASHMGHDDIVQFLAKKIPKWVSQPDNESMTPLWMACEAGHVETAKFLLETAPELISVPDSEGVTPLMIACQNGHMDVVKMMTEKSLSTIFAQDSKGTTPLWKASQNGHLDIVKFLAEEASDTIATARKDGSTPLWAAAGNGHLETVRFLAEKGQPELLEKPGRKGATPLWVACEIGSLEVVKYLAQLGPKSVLSKVAKRGVSPIAIAAQQGHIEIVKYLFEIAPDTASVPNTPLVLAAEKGHIEIVNFLLEKAPQTVSIPTRNEETALFCASEVGHFEIVKLLANADRKTVSKGDINGATPLMVACQEGHFEIVKFLGELSPESLSKPAKDKKTPLWVACRDGHLEIVEYLFEKAPNTVASQTDDGQTPLFVATRNGRLEIVKFLFEKAPETVDIADIDGVTPLLRASHDGHLEVVKFLASKSPQSLTQLAKDGTNAFWRACDGGHVGVVKFLYEHTPQFVDLPDQREGETPLFAASWGGHFEVVKFLLEKAPASLEAVDYKDRTPLIGAALEGRQKTTQFLFDESPCSSSPVAFTNLLLKNETNKTALLFIIENCSVSQLHFECMIGGIKNACRVNNESDARPPSRSKSPTPAKTGTWFTIDSSASCSLSLLVSLTDGKSRFVNEIHGAGAVTAASLLMWNTISVPFRPPLATQQQQYESDQITLATTKLNLLLLLANIADQGIDLQRKEIITFKVNSNRQLLLNVVVSMLSPATFEYPYAAGILMAVLIAKNAFTEGRAVELDVKLANAVEGWRTSMDKISFTICYKSLDIFKMLLSRSRNASGQLRVGVMRFAVWMLHYMVTKAEPNTSYGYAKIIMGEGGAARNNNNNKEMIDLMKDEETFRLSPEAEADYDETSLEMAKALAQLVETIITETPVDDKIAKDGDNSDSDTDDSSSNSN